MTDVLLTWLCSYLLHSSLLIGGLWAAERAGLLRRLATSTQEALWRLALLGGLLSASLPLLPALPGPALPALDAAASRVAAQDLAPRPVQLSERPVIIDAPVVASRPSAQLGALPLATSIEPKAHDIALGFIALWLAGALLMLLGLAAQWLWLRRAVRRLPELADPRWRALASQLAADAGVPLPALRHARAGWASPLIAPGRVLCLPGWCLDLPDDEARAVLGHELAHLRRRDPAWRLLAAVLRALLWPQALNRVALQRLDLLAELACDAAAAAPAGQRLALAQSLLRCAEALRGAGHGPALACGAASAGSPLFARVRRLLKPDGDAPRERRGLRWGLLAAMLAGLVALPAVVISHTDARELLERFDLGGLADGISERSFIGFPGVTRMVSRYPGGSFAVRLDGKVTFTEAEDDVQTLAGKLVVREREGGLTREMALKSMGDGRVEREYRVGRDSQPLDEAGRQWWTKAVQRMAEAMTDPLTRAKKLYAKGGMDAVLADVERAGEDLSRRQRIDAAVRLDQPLPSSAQDRLIAATNGLHGGFERREALSVIARLPLAEPQQLAWLAAVAGTDGDFERREALAAIAPRLLTTPAVLSAWIQALGHIGGDFELRSAIETQVAATPQPAVLAAALQAAARLQGDFEKRETLAAVARRLGGGETELVQAYTRLAGGIQGGFEKREALVALLDRGALGQAGLEQVIAMAEHMDGDFERLQVLLRVADKLAEAQPTPAGMVDRLRRAGRGLGEFERGQLEKALDRLG
ncbi:MAG: M48 family metalloprotease [Burkholderiales bacterium]|nr:M48 family metalloprotease [Burkholderiales bacterium]